MNSESIRIRPHKIQDTVLTYGKYTISIDQSLVRIQNEEEQAIDVPTRNIENWAGIAWRISDLDFWLSVVNSVKAFHTTGFFPDNMPWLEEVEGMFERQGQSVGMRRVVEKYSEKIRRAHESMQDALEEFRSEVGDFTSIGEHVEVDTEVGYLQGVTTGKTQVRMDDPTYMTWNFVYEVDGKEVESVENSAQEEVIL